MNGIKAIVLYTKRKAIVFNSYCRRLIKLPIIRDNKIIHTYRYSYGLSVMVSKWIPTGCGWGSWYPPCGYAFIINFMTDYITLK